MSDNKETSTILIIQLCWNRHQSIAYLARYRHHKAIHVRKTFKVTNKYGRSTDIFD
uniref:Uncharacterized protein n=1 Tax=Arion vulgaris TaxID=1028688 RepID=A0A0B6Y9R2_9EUPU